MHQGKVLFCQVSALLNLHRNTEEMLPQYSSGKVVCVCGYVHELLL